MNHTAHCLLSYPDTDVLIGNFIGDYIKGRSWEIYTPGVQHGILLHRNIDSFTDNHPAVRASVARIRPFAGRYSPPVVDILYDYLLCLHWDHLVPMPFDKFADWAYRGLNQNRDLMPPPLLKRWPDMLAGHFLDGYRTRDGLEWVLSMFARRLPVGLNLGPLLPYFFAEIATFSSDFLIFFPDIQRETSRFGKLD